MGTAAEELGVLPNRKGMLQLARPMTAALVARMHVTPHRQQGPMLPAAPPEAWHSC